MDPATTAASQKEIPQHPHTPHVRGAKTSCQQPKLGKEEEGEGEKAEVRARVRAK